MFYFSVENKLGRPRHVDMIVTAPLDVKRPAVHHNAARTTRPVRQTSGNSRSTGPCAASLGDAAATLPDARPDASVRHHLCKLDIAALREGRVILKDASRLAHLVNIISEDDIVRIAHRDENTLIHTAASHKLRFVFQYRLAHVDGDRLNLAVCHVQLEYLDTRQCQQPDFRLACQAFS